MKKIFLILAFFMATLASNAHGIDGSSMVLVEQKDGSWSIQIRSALNAFRREVRKHYFDTPYKTPEEFKEQLLEHIGKTIKISINKGKQQIDLGNGTVKLGHETSIYFKGIKIPDNFYSLEVDGHVFKDISRSKLKLFVLKEGIKKTPIILSKKNNYTANIVVREEGFLTEKEKVILSFVGLISILTLLVIALFSFVFFKKNQFSQPKFSN